MLSVVIWLMFRQFLKSFFKQFTGLPQKGGNLYTGVLSTLTLPTRNLKLHIVFIYTGVLCHCHYVQWNSVFQQDTLSDRIPWEQDL